MKITYEFKFLEENSSWVYDIEFDNNRIIIAKQENLPEWTRLEYQQCPNCPLNRDEHTHCPIAVNIHQMVEKTKEMKSFKVALVSVHSDERTYSKKTDLQNGLFSMMGVVMAGSACPHFDFLKPLISFHLPFASVDETLFRAASAHLLGLYLTKAKGEEVDFSMDALKGQYASLEKVNMALLERIRSIAKGDADGNALVALNSFAQMFSFEFESNFQSLIRYYETT